MVARGDLGVEVPAQEVPLIQKKLVLRAKKARIPVIIATQMMETMITSLTPTRAEVNDVANSVMDGADAVMLSGETSVGNYPIEVIEKMTNILTSVEGSDLIKVPQEPKPFFLMKKRTCFTGKPLIINNITQSRDGLSMTLKRFIKTWLRYLSWPLKTQELISLMLFVFLLVTKEKLY